MRTYYLNPVIYNKLYSCMQYPNALALRTSLETGLRIDDVLSLTTRQLEKRTLYGIAKKTKKAFKKTISQDLANRLRQIQGNLYIFEGRLDKTKHRTRQAVWKDVKKASKLLHIHGNIAPHSARKTYGVEKFKEAGIGTVQRELQHNDVSTTVLYAFADYLDNPNRRLEEENITCDNISLNGDFWLTFADLVAEKTVEKLIDFLKSC